MLFTFWIQFVSFAGAILPESGLSGQKGFAACEVNSLMSSSYSWSVDSGGRGGTSISATICCSLRTWQGSDDVGGDTKPIIVPLRHSPHLSNEQNNQEATENNHMMLGSHVARIEETKSNEELDSTPPVGET